jgi:hypothetical protein
MTRSIRMGNGDEYDALTKGGRKVHTFKPGVRARIKRRFRRRERRVLRKLENA